MTAPFIIYALPRSRTTWLSAFLSYAPWTCHHDAAALMDSLDDVSQFLRMKNTGICETALAFAARALYRLNQDARVVVVRRPAPDVAASLAAQGYILPPAYFEAENRALDRAAAIPGALSVSFDALETEAGARAVFEHCLQLPFDHDWWARLSGRNIQTDLPAAISLGANRRPYFDAMRAEAAQIMAMPAVQNESWDQFFADGRLLFDRHYAEAGPGWTGRYDPNWALAAKAYRLGMLQITTARAGGRLVGYLLCQIEHSLEDQTSQRGIQIPFFIERPYRGPLALKMHRFMRQSLAARGVRNLTVRSGIRGVGCRQDSLFKYLRAQPDGHMFNMMIGAA